MAAERKVRGRECNVCEKCGEPLRADDGHYHSAVDSRGLPFYICCKCKGCEGYKVQPGTVSTSTLAWEEKDFLNNARVLGQFSLTKSSGRL